MIQGNFHIDIKLSFCLDHLIGQPRVKCRMCLIFLEVSRFYHVLVVLSTNYCTNEQGHPPWNLFVKVSSVSAWHLAHCQT